MSTSSTGHSHHQRVPQSIVIQSGGSLAKSLPRIPKFSQSNNYNKLSKDNDVRNRDPRSRRNKEETSGSSKSKSSPSSKDKSKLSPSSKSASSRSGDRKKSGSSDDSSPRKKGEDEKKSSKSPSSHHRLSHSSSSKSPAKSSSTSDNPAKDVDLRMVPGSESSMKPDSTTNHPKSNKDKLLNDLLNGEDMKSCHEMITSDDNGKENKPILVVTINIQRFIVAIL